MKKNIMKENMAKRMLILCFLLSITVLSCQKKSSPVDVVEEEEEDTTYTLPRPKLTISNPFPSIAEEIELTFESDADVTASWDLGDGKKASSQTVKHVYNENGDYKVSLELNDGKGGTVKVDTTVAVMGKRMNDALVDLLNNPSQKWICAHRGFTYYGKKRGNIPENSIEAIEKSIEVGVEMIEVDVRMTSDGELVLMHDETINRTTNGSGLVKDISLAMLKRLNLKDDNGGLTTSKVPTLAEALIAGRGKVYFDLDLKEISPAAVVRVVESVHMLDRVAFYRGSSRARAKEISDVNSQSIIFPYVNNASAIEQWSQNPRIKMIQYNYNNESTASTIVQTAKEKGMASFANFLWDPAEAMLNGDYSVLDLILAQQAHIIQTDYAEYVKAYLSR